MKKLIAICLLLPMTVIKSISQKVGIGTTTPEEKFTIKTATSSYGLLHTDGVISIGTWVGGTGAYFGTKSPHPIRFFTGNGATTMILQTYGNLGLGVIEPSVRLHIKQDAANRAIQWDHESLPNYWTMGIGTNTYHCRFEYNGLLRAQISSDDGAYIAISDLGLKQEIVPLATVIGKAMQLQPCTYFFKDSRSRATRRSMGFIAQEVEKVFPEMVYDMDGDMKGLNYAAFSVVAIKAIQEQQQQLQLQQSEIAQQKATISLLETRLLKMEAALSKLAVE